MTRGSSRIAAGFGATLAALTIALLGPQTASASEPRAAAISAAPEGPVALLDNATELLKADTEASLGSPGPLALSVPPLALSVPPFVAIAPGPASFIAPPIVAKRAKDRAFDTSHGEVDPRVRNLPRTHRFRFTLHAQHIRLTQAPHPETDEVIRYHFAPMMFDLGYQAQFLKYVMVRLAVAVGGNVANSRNAQPLAVFPQGYLGFQSRIIGVAFGYGFDWTIPPVFHATAQNDPAEQPTITRNHVVMGELSATSRIDRVALTFSFAFGGVQSDLTHYAFYERKWRPYIGLQAGMFFDGTSRREKKARKRAEAQGR
ncbi:hypothetical protein DB30_01721 [Enhygromyxa salina]|uniref:Outer membrane protein beta-barrel domain-containing protein n=1 Tax=Enhygromyxa salina TaxID=215803 RepID=A0A0C2DF12_9BACT|nr:hypothetical protein [Enhygromyxa salina]KIG18217.1 hypothetical protein DB30_01721 [Enhygromyxa salina]